MRQNTSILEENRGLKITGLEVSRSALWSVSFELLDQLEKPHKLSTHVKNNHSGALDKGT